MNLKRVFLGAFVFWLVTNALSFGVSGYLIHEMILDSTYQASEPLWRPELRQDPPDMVSLMPGWLLMSFLSSLVVAGIYSCVRGSFNGPGWKKGMSWGLCLSLFTAVSYFGLTGVMNLPHKIALWWSIDAIFLFVVGGAAMGWAVEKWADD